MNVQTKNTLCSVLQHITAIVCGLILPREILSHYGSEMNGMVHSISQFLSYTVLLEMGIGAVIPAALYQPLEAGDFDRISAILSSGYRVFRRIAGICTVYILLLTAVFPAAAGVPSSAWFILVLGLGTVIHYLFGKPESLLIVSDQKGYVLYGLGTAATLLSTAVQVALIRGGNPLILVRLAGSLLSIGQIAPVLLYARRHYRISVKVRYTEEPIPQKWNGIAQHVAYFILENTDIILLSLFTAFREVSVYSVYFMVISGVRRIFTSVTYSMQPKLGELRARGDGAALNSFFAGFERGIHVGTVLVFGGLGIFLVPFVQVYTEGITDANYVRPAFAALMTAAYGLQSLRDPYDKLILASGHFRQTQNNYIIAAALNLGVSMIAVQFWGLEGVALGTLLAMGYQMVYMSLYDSGKILFRPEWIPAKTLLLDVGLLAVILLAGWLLHLAAADIIRWILNSVFRFI